MARVVKGRERVQVDCLGCILTLPLNSCVVFGKLHNLSVSLSEEWSRKYNIFSWGEIIKE